MAAFLKNGYYKLDENGIFVSEDNCDISTKFSDSVQNSLFETEYISWWFEYRANVIAKLFLKYCDIKKTTFDIGGGNGYTTSILRQLMRDGRVGIIEPSYGACLNARKREIEYVVCGSIDETSPERTIDQAILLDVLEHIENPAIFLKNIYNVMTEKGKIIVTVPAFMSLWSNEDKQAGHFKRYRLNELRKEIESVGFEIKYISYFMCFLYIPILLVRVWGEKIGIIKKPQYRTEAEQQKITEKQFTIKNGIVKTVLTLLEKYEMKKIVSGKSVRLGSSLVAIGVKSNSNLNPWDMSGKVNK